MKTLHLRVPSGQTLAHVVDFVFARKPGLPDKATTFELIEDAKTVGGSGDHAIVEIVIRFENPDEQDLEDIREIVALATSASAETKITVTETDS